MNRAEKQRQQRLESNHLLEPSGEYEMQQREAYDFHPLWKAGWKVPQETEDAFYNSPKGDSWAIVDTGNREIIVTGSKEKIAAIYNNYLITDKILLYEPKSLQDIY